MPQFARYLGIDYSGAATPMSSLKGLSVYAATPEDWPVEIPPPPSPRKYWTRRGLAEWLAAALRHGPPTCVGLITPFPFRCAISRHTGFLPTGLPFSTTSMTIGRPTATIFMLISSAKVGTAGAPRGPGMLAGGG